MRNKLRRPLAFLLSAVMIVTMSGTPVHAVADRGQPETGLCEHHTAHTDDCGYTEETPGTPCGHEHTEDCYTEVTECVHEHTPECYRSETEDSVSGNEATPANAEKREPENCPHICDGESGCITEKLDCRHEHDSECGYTESTPGTPCTYVCEICNPQDSGEADEEPETGIIKQEQCSCLTLCTEGQINPDCLVCGAENADLSDCKGKAAEEDMAQPEDTSICKHHREHDDACGYQPESEDSEGSPCTYECRICPIEDLIATLPDKVTEDNAEDVRARLDEIHALFSELTEGEQEQIDLSRCYALQEALDETNDPDPITESVEYQEASWDGSQVTYESKTETCTLVENSAEAVTWTAGWYAVSGTVTIDQPITVTGAVNLILTDGCDLTAEKGIVVTSTNSLTIYAQSGGTGTLTATGTVDGNNASAGIGGSTASLDSGTITIHGGVINATGGSNDLRRLGGAGIGGGSSGSGNGGSSGGIVTIYGGTITAKSAELGITGAGIGGGGGATNGGDGNNIQIYGGTVRAIGGASGAGIGGGSGKAQTISGTVSAYKSGNGTGITISGGIVTAVGGEYAAGIGGGSGYHQSILSGDYSLIGGTGGVNITGGIVDASSPTEVYCTGYEGAPIGNGGNASGTANVSKTTGIVFENGAGTVCGDVTLDGSYNVPGDYTLNIPAGASLSGSGTLTGGGTFTTDLSEDMVSVPTDLYYNGQDRSNDIKTRLSDGLPQGIVICGQTFAVSGWTVAVSRTDDLHYTATYTNESDTTKNFTKTITLQQSGTTLDGAVKTYNGETETKDFTASDTITVKATPTATGQAPANSAMFAASFTGPGAGQMAVFVGDTQVSAPADVGEDGTYTMTVSAADVLAAAGDPGTGITLTAKFVGNNNMADAAGTVNVNISAVAKVEKYGATTYVGNLDDAFKKENDSATITLLKDIERTGPLDIEINCTLNLGGYKISSSSGVCIRIREGANVIIEGEGEVISENSRALWVEGSATLEGGTFTSRNHNAPSVYVNGNETTTTLSVTGKNVVIREPTGSGIGLKVWQAKSIQLSSGTYSGWRAIDLTSGFFTLDQLLGHSGDTRYAYFDKNGELLTGKLNDQSLTGTVTVKPCDHSTVTAADNGNGTHSTPECPACGLAGVENQAHDWNETTPCTVCGAVAVAKVVNGSSTTYVGALADAFTEGNSGATVTLLSEVDLGSNYIEIRGSSTFTLDLNGQTVKAADYGAFNISGGSLTIQDSGTGGKIESSYITIGVKSGTLSIKSGTVSGFYGVGISGGTVNISGGVISGEEMGLWVHNSGKAVLSGGTLIGKKAVSIHANASVTLKNLLAEGYAYHRNNLPVTKAEGWVDSNTWGEVSLDTKAELAGTVTVKKCNHTGEGVCEYTPNEGAETHDMTCLACGYAGAAEDCQYTYTPDSGGEHHITACQFCGRTKTEAHTYGSWTPEHNENAVTIRRSCENCGYTKTDGTFTAPAHGQTMQYGKPITLTCSSTLPGATFSWSLKGSTAEGTGASFTLPETLAVGSYLYDVTVKWPGSESNICTKMVIFEVTPAPLTATGATAEGRAYDGTNSVEITGVTLAGILNGDDVSVDTTGLTGTLNGSNAGTYTNLTLPAMTLTGADAENYTVTRLAGAVPASVTIRKAAPLTPKTGDLAVANKQEHTYTYGLGALRPDVPEGMSLGSTAVTYELGPVNLGSYYDSGAMIDGQTLTLPIKAVESDSETKIGTITITIHTQNFKDMTATIDVRSVNKQSVDISGVTLTGRTYNGSPIEYQQTATASVDGKTVNVNGFVYTWDTPNHAAPVNAGNYTLTVSVDPEDRNYTGSTTIPVVIEQAEIRVTAPSKTIYVGETAPVFSAADCNITGLVQGENLKTPPTVAYAEAPDTSKTGSVTVTASGAEVPEGGNYKDRIVYENGTLTITSKPLPPAKYTITVQAGTGGTASASPASAEKGTKITLTATPDSGYHFKEWQVISGGVTISNNSFTMPDTNVTVKAVFVKNSNGGGNSGGSGSGGGSSSGGNGSSSGDNGSSGGGSTIVARPDETKPDTPTTSQTKPAAPDKNGNVAVDNGTVQSAINTAKNDAKKNGNTANGVAVVIPVTPKEGQNSFNVTINAQTLNTLVREKVKRLEINIEGVIVEGMDADILKLLDTLSANGDIILRVKKTDPSGLSKEAKAAIGTRPVYDLSLVYLSGGKETPITDFDGHTIAVRLPYAPAKDEKTGNLYAVYVDGKGKVEWLTKSSYDPDLGTVVFETGHFSIYGIGYKNPAPVFTDIKNHWAEHNIIFAASRGLITGTGNNQFSPDTGMTRGMFATSLGRLAGIDPNSYKTGKFTDVKADTYYAPYVNWAAEEGIVNSTSATTFSPDTTITREQMAVIMANYAKKLGYELPVIRKAVTFVDNAQISGWAAKKVKTMQQAGIFIGKKGNRFDPQGTATRAEGATVLRRFVEIIVEPQTAQGWMQNHSGSWQYMKNGKPVTGWLQDDEKWYWLDNNGLMFAGGFKQIGGKWYYFYPDGSMAVNTTIDGYTIGSDGARK